VKMAVRKSRTIGRDAFGLDAIAHGGFPSEAIEVMCGTRAKTVTLRKGKGTQPPPAAELPRLQSELHMLFSAALPRRFLCCCDISTGKYPPGIVTDHCYAVLGYDPQTQQVTVMNPWGNHFEPKGPPGMEHGYATKSGAFTLPLSDFVQIFETVYYQTSLPPKVR
jgi:hypothetical protein